MITYLRPSREKYLCTWFWFPCTATLGARTQWWQWRRIWNETSAVKSQVYEFIAPTYLEAGYMPLRGFVPGTQAWILCPKIELILTMCPTVPCSSSRFFISREASLVTRHNPMMLVSIVRYSSTVFLGSKSSPFVMTPALLIRRSTPPQTSSIHLKAALTWFSSRMSHSMQFRLPFKMLVESFRTACWETCDHELERKCEDFSSPHTSILSLRFDIPHTIMPDSIRALHNAAPIPTVNEAERKFIDLGLFELIKSDKLPPQATSFLAILRCREN